MKSCLFILSFVFIATFGQNTYAIKFKSKALSHAVHTVTEVAHDTVKTVGQGAEKVVRDCRDTTGEAIHDGCKGVGQGVESAVRKARDVTREELRPLGDVIHKVCRESGKVGHDIVYIAGKGVESSVRDLKTPQGAIRFAVIVGMTFVPGVGPLALIAINTGTGTLLSFTQPGQHHTLENLGKTIAVSAATSTAGVLIPSGGGCLANAIASTAASSATSSFTNSVASQYVYNNGKVNFGDALKAAGQGAVIGAVGGAIDHNFAETPSKTFGQFCDNMGHHVVRNGVTGAVSNMTGQMANNGKVSDWKQVGQQGFHDGAQGGIDWMGQRLAHNVIDSIHTPATPKESNKDKSETNGYQDEQISQNRPSMEDSEPTQDASLDKYKNKLKKTLERNLDQKNLNNLTLDDALDVISKSTKAQPDQNSIQQLKKIEQTHGREKAIEIAKKLAVEARATNDTRRIQRQMNQTKKSDVDFSTLFPSVENASKQFPEKKEKVNSVHTATTSSTNPQQNKGFLDQTNEKFCFVADTFVLTINGYKPIQEIKAGEKVLSCHFDNDQNVCNYDDIKEVLEIGSRNIDRITRIKFNDGQKIKSTPEHPYFVMDSKSWVPAEDLLVGDHILTHEGKVVEVEKIKSVNLHNTLETVYNIEIEDNNNFYISCKRERDADGILVHNCKFQQNNPILDQVLDFAPIYPIMKDAQTIFMPNDCNGQPISPLQKGMAMADAGTSLLPGVKIAGNVAKKGVVRIVERGAIHNAEVQVEKKALQNVEHNIVQHKVIPNPKPNSPTFHSSVGNGEKLSKVTKSKTVEKIGDNFTKITEVRPGKGPGQSRAEYVRIKNQNGEVVKTYKDTYDRSDKFMHRKPLRGGPEGRPAND